MKTSSFFNLPTTTDRLLAYVLGRTDAREIRLVDIARDMNTPPHEIEAILDAVKVFNYSGRYSCRRIIEALEK